MHIVPVCLFRGLAALVLSALLSACSGLSVSEGPFSQAARVVGEKPSGQLGVYLEVAQEALDARDYATAIRFYETILDRAPGNLAAAKGVAAAYTRDGRIGQAVNAWRAAMALAPDDRLVQENLATLLNSQTMPAAGQPSPAVTMKAVPKYINLSMDLAYSGTLSEEMPPVAVLPVEAVTHTTIGEARIALQSVADTAMVKELELAGLDDIAPAAGNPFLLYNPPVQADRSVRTASAESAAPTVPDSAPARVQTRPRIEAAEIMADAAVSAPTDAALKRAAADNSQYRVQLAAYRSAGHARRGIAILRQLLGEAGAALEILERRNAGADSSAVNFRIRTAALGSQQAAASFCASVRALGQECLAIRHASLTWQPIA